MQLSWMIIFQQWFKDHKALATKIFNLISLFKKICGRIHFDEFPIYFSKI